MLLDAPINLLSTHDLLNLPPTKWLMQELIPEGSFVGLYGQPGSGKSFIALDWAMCISEGKPWLDRFATSQCPVIYVAAEGGRGIQKRVRAWMKHYGYADLPAMYFLLNPLYVREDGVVEAFLEDLEFRDIWPGLIVLDTLSRSFGSGEENASADMGLFVDRMTRLAQGRDMAALVVHHTNAQGARERGHTAFRGATDAMFQCIAEKDKHSNAITLVTIRNDKQKDEKDAEPIYVRPLEGVSASLIFEETTAPVARSTPGSGTTTPMRKVDMLNVLAVAPDGLTWQEWRLASGVDKSRFGKRLRKLVADGDVIKENGRYYPMPANRDLADVEEP